MDSPAVSYTHLVDIRAKLCRRLAALVHDFEPVGCALVLQSAVQGLDDTGRIAAVAGVVVGGLTFVLLLRKAM